MSTRAEECVEGLLAGKCLICIENVAAYLLLDTVKFPFRSVAEPNSETSIRGPGLYISIVSFNQELLPTPLLISLAAQREGVPFPAFLEALMMMTIFEVLREAFCRPLRGNRVSLGSL